MGRPRAHHRRLRGRAPDLPRPRHRDREAAAPAPGARTARGPRRGTARRALQRGAIRAQCGGVAGGDPERRPPTGGGGGEGGLRADRKRGGEGKRGDLGGARVIKKKKRKKRPTPEEYTVQTEGREGACASRRTWVGVRLARLVFGRARTSGVLSNAGPSQQTSALYC